MMTINQLLAKAKKHYIDGSHGWSHIEDVLRRAVELKGSSLTLIETAAIAYHDSSLSTGDRETHEIDSGRIVREELSQEFDEKTMNEIVDAIACHRASYDKPRTSELANLVAAADRNPPDARKMFARSFQYALEHGLDRCAAAEHAVTHISEKYGQGGYAYRNVPEIYLNHNRDLLARLWEEIASTSASDVLAYV